MVSQIRVQNCRKNLAPRKEIVSAQNFTRQMLVSCLCWAGAPGESGGPGLECVGACSLAFVSCRNGNPWGNLGSPSSRLERGRLLHQPRSPTARWGSGQRQVRRGVFSISVSAKDVRQFVDSKLPAFLESTDTPSGCHHRLKNGGRKALPKTSVVALHHITMRR